MKTSCLLSYNLNRQKIAGLSSRLLQTASSGRHRDLFVPHPDDDTEQDDQLRAPRTSTDASSTQGSRRRISISKLFSKKARSSGELIRPEEESSEHGGLNTTRNALSKWMHFGHPSRVAPADQNMAVAFSLPSRIPEVDESKLSLPPVKAPRGLLLGLASRRRTKDRPSNVDDGSSARNSLAGERRVTRELHTGASPSHPDSEHRPSGSAPGHLPARPSGGFNLPPIDRGSLNGSRASPLASRASPLPSRASPLVNSSGVAQARGPGNSKLEPAVSVRRISAAGSGLNLNMDRVLGEGLIVKPSAVPGTAVPLPAMIEGPISAAANDGDQPGPATDSYPTAFEPQHAPAAD